MADSPPPASNAKIYQRPEKKTPSPLLLLVIAVIVLAIIGVAAYRFFAHGTPAPAKATAAVRARPEVWRSRPGRRYEVVLASPGPRAGRTDAAWSL